MLYLDLLSSLIIYDHTSLFFALQKFKESLMNRFCKVFLRAVANLQCNRGLAQDISLLATRPAVVPLLANTEL